MRTTSRVPLLALSMTPCLALVAATFGTTFGQAVYGSVFRTVTDSSGAAVPNAEGDNHRGSRQERTDGADQSRRQLHSDAPHPRRLSRAGRGHRLSRPEVLEASASVWIRPVQPTSGCSRAGSRRR